MGESSVSKGFGMGCGCFLFILALIALCVFIPTCAVVGTGAALINAADAAHKTNAPDAQPPAITNAPDQITPLPVPSPPTPTNTSEQPVPAPSTVATDNAEAAAYRVKATAGDAEAAQQLGYLYLTGQGVTKDLTEGLKWIQIAANLGNAKSQYNLGMLYYNGQGVTQDYNQALSWYQKAADQGVAEAQFSMGHMYENAQGVTRDIPTAVEWYKKAAAQGQSNAQAALKRLGIQVSTPTPPSVDTSSPAPPSTQQSASDYNAQGFDKYTKGDFDGAIADYNQAIALDPKLAQAYNNRGIAKRDKGDLDDAITDHKQAVALNPKFATSPPPDYDSTQEEQSFVDSVRKDAPNINEVISSFKLNGDTLVVKVTDKYSNSPYQDRLQFAQGIYKRWAGFHNDKSATWVSPLSMIDTGGTQVGGMNASEVWVTRPPPTQKEANALVGLTEAQVISKLGQPIRVVNSDSPDGPFEQLIFNNSQTAATFCFILKKDSTTDGVFYPGGTVSEGSYRGLAFPQ